MTSVEKSEKGSDKNLAADKNQKPLFQDGETVFCYHGPVLYEAKCMKSELRNKQYFYFVHYSGWNKNWDEWVPASRVLKFNDENMKKQEELLATHGTSKIMSKIKQSTRRSQAASIGDSDRTSQDNESEPKKKRKGDDSSEHDDSYQLKCDISIKIPDELRQILEEDYQNICISNRLVHLPPSYNVEHLLNDYRSHKIDMKFDKNVINEVVEGLKCYFNSVLPTKLLYKSERSQYDDVNKNCTKKASELYGTIHFLRLFVKIGELLSYTPWDEVATKQLILNIEDVLKYLLENRATLFNGKNLVYMKQLSD